MPTSICEGIVLVGLVTEVRRRGQVIPGHSWRVGRSFCLGLGCLGRCRCRCLGGCQCLVLGDYERVEEGFVVLERE